MQKKLIIIMGPSGSGKTTISSFLHENFKINRVVTHTTRQKRQNEVDGVDYYFETPESFEQKTYFEKVEYSGYYYGSSREALDNAWKKDDVVSLIVDTAGAKSYADILSDDNLIMIYLKVNDQNILRQRLLDRGDNAEIVEKRMTSPEFLRDLKVPVELKNRVHVIENDDLDAAKDAVASLLKTLIN